MLAKKSPRVDENPMELFTEQWEVIKDDVRNVIAEFFFYGKLPKNFSFISLTLVPKVKAPTYVKGYRPITCCTTFYKLIPKILTYRIKSMINTIISPS